jgi:hypothetical protein
MLDYLSDRVSKYISVFRMFSTRGCRGAHGAEIRKPYTA